MFFLLGLAIAVLGMVFFELLLGGNLNMFIDLASLIFILFPLTGVLLATRSFKVFYAGLRAAIFPKEDITEEMRGRAASLFRLLSKVSVMAGGMGTLISLVNMLMNLDFSDVGGGIASLGINVAVALLTLLYGLLLVVVVFEPVVFILKKRSAKRR